MEERELNSLSEGHARTRACVHTHTHTNKTSMDQEDPP
jgi:predicted metal-dependent phosphotriesterase family hydrolase